MTAVNDLRARYKDAFLERHGIKLGFMSFFVKAAVDALQTVPAVNARIDGTDIIYRKYQDIGIVVGGGRGLLVPVLRNAESMNLAAIELAIANFAKRRCRTRSASPSCRAAPSRSRTAGSMARCCRHPSSTRRNPASSACMPSRTGRWRSTGRWSCGP